MKTKSTIEFSDKQKYYTSKNSILGFFLNLYKMQMGVYPETPGRFVLLDDHRILKPDDIYELQVKNDQDMFVRRMTIGPLGDGSGSKSMCFKVIYDDLLVIKIPPYPIKEFDQYLYHINIERQIAQKLMDSIECISPEVSALLKRIPNISFGKDNIDPKTFEGVCIQHLRKYKNYQEFLKIGESFVFFMNLSKHSFLSQIVDQMHNKSDKVSGEITKQEDVLFDLLVFEEKYGEENSTVFFEMNDIYTRYEDEMKSLLQEYGLQYSIQPYQLKNWFLSFLAWDEVRTNEPDVSPELIHDMNQLLRKIMNSHSDDTSRYYKMMERYVNKVMFSQNKALFAGIITNLLELLYWIREKGVAIRDLKPDNMFIVGDAAKSPFLLAMTSEYSIGLIDFETAVSFKGSSIEDIPQPMLAGTPSYATPSHMYPNDILMMISKNLPRIFYLQDWQAVVGMIFYVITGERLFDRARKSLMKIGSINRAFSAQSKSKLDAFKYASVLFWQSASEEFEIKIKRYERRLKAVESCLSESIKQMFEEELSIEKQSVIQKMKACIRSQTLFRSEKSQQDLLRSSSVVIARCSTNWKKGVNIPKTRPAIRKQVILFLNRLESLKNYFDKIERCILLLKQDKSKISAYELMTMIFDIVKNLMFSDEWVNIVTDATNNNSLGKQIKSGEEAVSIEDSSNVEKTISL